VRHVRIQLLRVEDKTRPSNTNKLLELPPTRSHQDDERQEQAIDHVLSPGFDPYRIFQLHIERTTMNSSFSFSLPSSPDSYDEMEVDHQDEWSNCYLPGHATEASINPPSIDHMGL
jgi:hypothetical protein